MKTKITLPFFHIDQLIYPFIRGAFVCKKGTYLDGFFLVDSGSSVNIFNKEALHLLSEESFCEETFKVDAFNNEGEECQVTNVSIKVGDIECIELFNVSQNLDFSSYFGKNRIIGILGVGFMLRNGLVLDYSQQCVRSSEISKFIHDGKSFACPMNGGINAYGIPLVCMVGNSDDFLCVVDSGCNISTITQYAMENGARSFEHIDGKYFLQSISGESLTDLAKVDFSLFSVKEEGNNYVPDTDVFQVVTNLEYICRHDDEDIPPIYGLISSSFMLRNKWILDFKVGFIYENAS